MNWTDTGGDPGAALRAPSLKEKAIFHYNLACYSCVLGQIDTAREALQRSFALDKPVPGLCAVGPRSGAAARGVAVGAPRSAPLRQEELGAGAAADALEGLGVGGDELADAGGRLVDGGGDLLGVDAVLAGGGQDLEYLRLELLVADGRTADAGGAGDGERLDLAGGWAAR